MSADHKEQFSQQKEDKDLDDHVGTMNAHELRLPHGEFTYSALVNETRQFSTLDRAFISGSLSLLKGVDWHLAAKHTGIPSSHHKVLLLQARPVHKAKSRGNLIAAVFEQHNLYTQFLRGYLYLFPCG